MKTKSWWLCFLGLFSCFVHAQTVINTNHPNNNGNGSVTFNVQNTNAYDIIIIGAQCHLGTTPNNAIELLYNTNPYVDTAPPWDFGIIAAGQNGWISAGTDVVSNSNTANGIVSILPSLSLTIPAGATYQLGLSATTMQYSSLTNGAGINTFSGGGVNLFTGDGISWGGTVYPSTPANYPRGLIGGITFVQVLHFSVSAPTTAEAGTAFNMTVTALDPSNNVMTGYTGTVHFTSTDSMAVLPADATLTNGTGTFSASLDTAGNQTITATDTATAAITGTTSTIGVSAATTGTHFVVSAPSATTAGTAFNLTVTAQDPFNNVATGYSGTVHFTSTDAAAVLPADATLTNGTGVFNATLATVGNQTITATDTVTASITGTTAPTTVSAGAATHFSLNTPTTVTTGASLPITVTALDSFNNTDTAFAGTVHFTSTDGSAVLPADSTLSNGAGTFSAALETPGNQTITATDTVTPAITGSSGSIAVNSTTPVRLQSFGVD
jgi:predicted secreted protein